EPVTVGEKQCVEERRRAQRFPVCTLGLSDILQPVSQLPADRGAPVRILLREHTEPLVQNRIGVEEVTVESFETACIVRCVGSPALAEGCPTACPAHRPALRKDLSGRYVRHRPGVLRRLFGYALEHSVDPRNGSHVHGRGPLGNVDAPAYRLLGDTGEEPFHQGNGTQPVSRRQIERARLLPDLRPEPVLGLSFARPSPPHVPRELLKVGHHHTLVAGLVGKVVRPPQLPAGQGRVSFALGGDRPCHFPVSLRLATPDGGYVNSKLFGAGHIPVPHYLADVP